MLSGNRISDIAFLTISHHKCIGVKEDKKSPSKSIWSGYVGRAAGHRALTGAVPLLTPTGTLGCWL